MRNNAMHRIFNFGTDHRKTALGIDPRYNFFTVHFVALKRVRPIDLSVMHVLSDNKLQNV